ncbi:LapA family protein [Oceanobacillus sp. CAU 1775]
MNGQWALIIGLVLAILMSILAVINVEAVSVNLIFTEIQMPLIILILLSAFIGAIISGALASRKMYHLNKENKHLKQKAETLEKKPKKQPSKTIELKQEDNKLL